jgi:spore germination protein YaaH
MRAGAVVCASAVVALSWTWSHVYASAASTLAVTGYIEQGSPPGAIDRSAAALTTVGVDGVNLVSSGDRVTAAGGPALALLARAHADGLRGELLVGNFDDAINDFSPETANALLASTKNVQSVALQLAQMVVSEGWDGITVDLESLTANDQVGLVDFLATLRSEVPAGCTISVDIQAATSLTDYAASGYDLARLGQVVDRLVLMAYDQHGPWSRPGPIGALNWQRQSLQVLLGQVSAAKVDLGVAGYGYTWPRGSSMHKGTSFSDAWGRRLVRANHVPARWDSVSGEWTARLRNGTRLWWSDGRSYALRVALAASMHLHGVALWQLASADPLIN